MAPRDETTSGLRWLGLPPRIALGFGAALVSLAAAAAASNASLDARAAASELFRHTAAARLAVEEIESALLFADVSLEAELASGDGRDRDRVLRAWVKVPPALADLRRISEVHPEEKDRIAQLAADLDAIRSQHAEVVALLAAGDVGAARALGERSAGRETLERAATALDLIEEDEAHAHVDREAAWKRSVAWSKAIFLAALAGLLLLLLLAARTVRDDIRQREADRVERERALAMQRRLMGVVSHDLRNPLGGILAAAWALARMELPPEALPVARRIGAAGRRMERLIRDLLDWSRVHGGAPIPIAAREADLHDVCRRIADELRDRGGSRIRVEREGDTRGVFDPDRMEQVAANLLSNALRCAPPDTAVLVRAVGTPDEVRLEVHDEGPGIPPEARAGIFEAFRQGPVGDGSGVGLGLFIVRALADAHGGSVDLDSAPGRTAFKVRVPRTPPAARAETASAGV
jgi:signal transduction histidine kinase